MYPTEAMCMIVPIYKIVNKPRDRIDQCPISFCFMSNTDQITTCM